MPFRRTDMTRAIVEFAVPDVTDALRRLSRWIGDFDRSELKKAAIFGRFPQKSQRPCGVAPPSRLAKERPMLRTFCFAAGIFIAMWGATFLMVDKITFAWNVEPVIERDPSFRGFYVTLNESKQRVFNPPQWLAFCLMSVGTVTMLYSIALPKKAA